MPSGLVTLMLTDIEGSTRLVHDLGDAYPPLLERVLSGIRSAVTAAGGYEVDARADEFFAAFAAAPDAISAAIRIQRSLEPERARVRIGLHSGSPAVTDTGYVGMPVHVAARICSAGHGGQILISSETRRELAGAPPAGVRLRDLGAHVLRGIPEPVELLQLDVEGLQAAFPPLRLSGPS
jgi:class 3 adenylate cyclase